MYFSGPESIVPSDSLVQSEPSKVTMVLCLSTVCLYAPRNRGISLGQFHREGGIFLCGQSSPQAFQSERKSVKYPVPIQDQRSMAVVPIAQGFVRWLQHSGETSVNDPKVKGSGQHSSYGQL
ncbi:hypothetical protein AVEN_82097-1 [Araneus ventricosus]|uniref:Uncharacterized protein n=1 Tax=Araneus ventricosus TaxID=182803 RepID=A0A4Y2T9H4_ARAVE|nr:hypothetical protein AVEN_82097-1 [Araneus ventricosus]